MKLSDWLANTSTSQSDFARKLGVTQGRVSQVVAGERPSLELAMKIAGATSNQVRPEDFEEMRMTKTLDTVEEAIKAVANGELVVVVDDDDRENEGDLIGAAAKITPEQMAFMVEFDLMNAKFGKYGEMNTGYTGDDVRGFSKIFGNQISIYHKVASPNLPINREA